MRNWIAAGAAIVLMASGAAQGQTSFHWPAPETAQTANAKRFYLPMGTPLMLRTRTDISTKDNKPGDRIMLEVVEAVSFRGQVVIPVGAPVFGEVARAQRNGHVGKKGKLEIRLIRVETPNGPVRLSGSAYDEGESGTAASVATMLLISPLGGFFIHGTSARIAAGTGVQAHLAEPLRFAWYPAADQQVATAAEAPTAYSDARSGSAAFGSPD